MHTGGGSGRGRGSAAPATGGSGTALFSRRLQATARLPAGAPAAPPHHPPPTPNTHLALLQGNDLEYWRYSYPLRDNHVPAWAVPLLALSSPLAAVGVARAMGRVTRLELHHAVLTACYCVVTTGVVTNFIKVNVRAWLRGAAALGAALCRVPCSRGGCVPCLWLQRACCRRPLT